MMWPMFDQNPAASSAEYLMWPGQSLMVARCNDAEEWSCHRVTVEQCRPEFVVLRFQAGYRECFD